MIVSCLITSMVEGREEHGGEVEQGLGVEPVVQRDQDSGEEGQVRQGQE